VTSDTPLQQLLRAVVRFWWVALLGIVLAVLAFTFATYRVTMSFPPKLEARAHSTYSASTQLLITSKGEPYLSSTNVNAKIIKLPDSTTASTTGTATGTQQNSTYDSGSGADGDLQRLVEIANSLPPRVTSDTVIRLRNKLFGRIAGSVSAVNPYAFSGAGGFREGPLPFIKIHDEVSFKLFGTIGSQYVERPFNYGIPNNDYWDWQLGATVTVYGVDLTFAYIGTNIDQAGCLNTLNCEDRFVFSVTKMF